MFTLAREPKKLVILPGLGHHDIYYGEHTARLLDTARAWFDLHLRGPLA
jgi:dipeptidyl aminopeptidase/acylaminoacyl peptidase